MASSSRGLQTVLQVALSIAILALFYILVISITEPYAAVERKNELTELTRGRMDQVRVAMIEHQRVKGRFVTTLDSLVAWIRSDATMMSKSDSVFGAGFMLDSLAYSPRTGKMFILAVNDTSRAHTYKLSDPDSDDFIGTTSGDVTELNAASWE